MAKFNAKNLGIAVSLAVLLVGVIGIVNAQQTLPKGGDSFETAIEIQPGFYEGGGFESRELEYFYVVDVKPGQEIDIEAVFTAADIDAGAETVLRLYSEDRTKLDEKIEPVYEQPVSLTISWLSGMDKDPYKYYIEIGSGLFGIASHSLDISLKTAPVKEPGEGVPPAEGEPAKGLNWALILGIIAVIVIIGIVAYFLLKKKK